MDADAVPRVGVMRIPGVLVTAKTMRLCRFQLKASMFGLDARRDAPARIPSSRRDQKRCHRGGYRGKASSASMSASPASRRYRRPRSLGDKGQIWE